MAGSCLALFGAGLPECGRGDGDVAGVSIRGGGGEVVVDSRWGDVVSAGAGGFRSGGEGLWKMKFASGETLKAGDFKLHPEWTVERDGKRFAYRNDKVEVVVEFVGNAHGVDVKGSVLNKGDDVVMEFSSPARLMFDPAVVDRFYMPQRGNSGLGMALKRSFFEETSKLAYPSWRLAGRRVWKRGEREENDAAVEKRLAEAIGASKRRKVGFIYMKCGPEWGALSMNYVKCRDRLYRMLSSECAEIVDIGSHAELMKALESDEYRFVFNTFCDFVPMTSADDVAPTVAAIKAYESRGGRWVSAAPAEEIAPLVPGGYLSYSSPYPNLAIDFCHLKTTDGAGTSVFAVRPRPAHVPWQCPRQFHVVAGELGVGGGPGGGYLDRSFKAYVRKGERFEAPAVRFAFDPSLDGALEAYAKANDITKQISEKAPARLVEKLKQAPVVTMYSTRADRCAKVAGFLPAPAVIHVSHYLKGGFDREYPDHLPTNEKNFGTDAEHAAFIASLHKAGHLYMPYTNPTWWCDHPRGPTFLAEGEAPLLVKLDGTHNHEVYKQDGWTSCFWHPAVVAANRRIVSQFTKDLPVDVLFQDQCGARRFNYDLNPAAPSPTAYTEGLLSQVEDAATHVPLGTEDGWDKVINEELCVFGMTWLTVPRHVDFRYTHDYHVLMKELISPETWEIEPLVLRIMHDKCIFYCHDLSGSAFCDRLVAWDLAIGYNLSYDASGAPGCKYGGRGRALARDRYLSALQKHVVSHIAGERLGTFRHDRGPLFERGARHMLSRADDGIVVATWGETKCVVNLGDMPRTVEGGVELAPYGYVVSGPGFRAEYLQGSHPKISARGVPNEVVIDNNEAGGVVYETIRID